MTYDVFNNLSSDNQLALIYRKGVYVGKRELDGFIAVLYQLDAFYVEIIYKVYRSVVHEIKTSPSTEFLELYLPDTKLEI